MDLSGNLREMPNGNAQAEALKAEMRAQAQPPYVNQVMIGSQVAATFHAKNAAAMMARMPSDAFRRSVWLNPDPPSYWRGGTADFR